MNKNKQIEDYGDFLNRGWKVQQRYA